MPYFLFKVTLVNQDHYGRRTGSVNKEAIRQEATFEIDNLCRKYNKKFFDHYGNTSVILSRLDPRVVTFVKNSQKNPEDDWWKG